MHMLVWMCYLMLISLQGARSAQTHRPLGGPSLSARLDAAAWPLAVAFGAGAASAYAIAGDLRRTSDGGRLSAWGVRLRVLGVVATAGSAAFLVASSIPRIEPWLAEGLGSMIGPAECVMVLTALASLGAGIAARGILPSSSDDAPAPRRWRRIARAIGRTSAVVVLLAFAALAVHAAAFESKPQFWYRLTFDELKEWTLVSWRWHVHQWFLTIVVFPHYLCATLGFYWLVGAALGALLRKGGPPAPFDAVWNDRATARRFLGYWTALTVLCISAIPVFFVGGLVVMNAAFSWLDAP